MRTDLVLEIVHTSIRDIGRSIVDFVVTECFAEFGQTTDWLMVTINKEHIQMAQ